MCALPIFYISTGVPAFIFYYALPLVCNNIE